MVPAISWSNNMALNFLRSSSTCNSNNKMFMQCVYNPTVPVGIVNDVPKKFTSTPDAMLQMYGITEIGEEPRLARKVKAEPNEIIKRERTKVTQRRSKKIFADTGFIFL